MGEVARSAGPPVVRLVDRVFGLPPPTARRITVREDVAVPMRDGVTLRADHYVPDDVHALVVLVRSPYGRKGMCVALIVHAFMGRPAAAPAPAR